MMPRIPTLAPVWRRVSKAILCCLAFVLPAPLIAQAEAVSANPQVAIETRMGRMVLELYPDKAPITVENFLALVASGHYTGSSFHRALENFVIQGGGYDGEYNSLAEQETITNEANNGLSNVSGTIAMARLDGEPHSASDQFFINLKNNWYLDHSSETRRGWGYCVFGKLIEGEDIARAISAVETGAAGELDEEAPVEPIIIDSIERIQ